LCMYPVHHEDGVYDGLNSIMTDFLFRCPSQRWANHSASRSPQCVRQRNLAHSERIFSLTTAPQIPLHVQPLTSLQHLQQELLRGQGSCPKLLLPASQLQFNYFPPPPLQACHALEVPLIFHASGPLHFDPSSERMRLGRPRAHQCIAHAHFFTARDAAPQRRHDEDVGRLRPDRQPHPRRRRMEGVGQRRPVQDELQSGWPPTRAATQLFFFLLTARRDQDSLSLSSDARGTCDELWNKWTVFWDIPAD
jgi:hypothetical protein